MIRDRPPSLLAIPEYRRLPPMPISVGMDALPELVRTSLGSLGGIQPVTGEMVEAAKGLLFDKPSQGEIELFRRRGTQFQLVSVVMNLAAFIDQSGVPHGIPYALSLIPASKGGAVSTTDIEWVARVDVDKIRRETEPCYGSYDPFSGDWRMYGPLRIISTEFMSGFVDELGLVVEQYLLATEYSPEDVLSIPMNFENTRCDEKYQRHRTKLLFRPFNQVKSRRIWGAESPIELFLFQELIRRNFVPMLQMIICDNGSLYPSMYHLWRDVEFRYAPGIITDADLYFLDQRVAVFCDSTKYHRTRKAQAKDQTISSRLQEIGVKAVRVPGSQIVNDLSAAADIVCRTLV